MWLEEAETLKEKEIRSRDYNDSGVNSVLHDGCELNATFAKMKTAVLKLGRVARSRSYAAVASSSSSVNPYTVGPFQVFDRDAKRMQKDRAASHDGGRRSRTVDYVRNEVADRMMERFLVRFHPELSGFS